MEYKSVEIYVAGRPAETQSVVVEGYSGCIQDIRLDQRPLPSFDSNQHATVTYFGDEPRDGCRVGPCHPNPCNIGNCSETASNAYLCSCPDGSTTTATCDPDRNSDTIIGIIIGISMGVFILILIVVLVVGLIVISQYSKRSGKYSVRDRPLTSNQINDYEIHANVFAYDEEGGGEIDTPIDDRVDSAEVEVLDSPALRKAVKHDSPSFSTLERARSLDVTSSPYLPKGDTPPVRGTPTITKFSPLKEFPEVIQGTPPLKGQIQGTPPIPNLKIPPRASTPDIDAFIEDIVNEANSNVHDIDSLKSFKDEGCASSNGSFSTISQASEPYTIERLRQAGPEFEHIAEVLEPLYYSTDEEESVNESDLSDTSTNS